MYYFSLTDQDKKQVSFSEATMVGQSPDGGLFFPTSIPQWDATFLQQLATISPIEMAIKVMQPYIGNDIDKATLKSIIEHTLSFDIPLKKINDDVLVLELFHGPTMAFKDVGARFLSRCLQHFSQRIDKQIVVLVATSGDTGGAVANSFINAKDVQVVILYPSGKVSPLQEKQLSYPSKNVHTLEVKGTFDDCQQIVKTAFRDSTLHKHIYLTSANSINISRWIPQQLYYILAYQQWITYYPKELPIFCVPSGNFGNICAGMLAHQSGLPIKHFIAACNANDVVTRYLHSGKYEPLRAVPTLSNAMDVGSPNNFVRVEQLFHHAFDNLKNHLSSYTVNDDETLRTIQQVHHTYGYTLDPHTAVAYNAFQQYQSTHPKAKGIILETAHPLKFAETVEKAIGEELPLTESAQKIMQQEKCTTVLEADYASFKAWMSTKF